MDRARRAVVLWGVIGALSFLVLLQAYELLADRRVNLLVKFGVAIAIGVATAGVARVLQRRLPAESGI
ncbi:hypothetical protein [Halapricum hydrolyticum]|uniref:DUF7981 domain-containing protein n=1 Tax=Halapricum hydrolyticum TaxID=2979991 RepID=A0AAE3I9N1_9EURY|nr:hypothetical protein [Halapricum hydrolyticum]MCU4719653.1 hypothetical protein [Halapricum hydrolyticum]MCU4725951.1 hypothetical protein [Halapricum hydrolyticum]